MIHSQYLTVQQILQRGWTRRLIEHYLGKEDARTAPGRRSGRPACLYSLHRVITVERTNPTLQGELALVQDRAGAARDRIVLKRQVLQDVVHRIPLPPLSVPLSELLTATSDASDCEHRVALGKLVDSMASLGELLNVYASHPGVREARKALQVRVLNHIREHYPLLTDEVQRQLEQLAE